MENERIVRISDLSRGGAGVSRDESGQVIFVPFSAPDDLLRVRLIKIEKRYAQAEIVEILEPSALRQSPPCPVFGKCGGCQWQHLPYSVQWATKVKGVLHALSRVQVAPPESSESFDQIPADQIWGYRNRIQLRGEGSVLGFFRPGSRDLVPVDRCEIARPEINQAWEETRSEGARFSRPYKVEVEVAHSGEVIRAWNSRHSASGFRQVHDEQNEKLKVWVSSVLGHVDVLYDLYGGSGNLSLPFADRVEEIHCVDVTSPTVHPPGVPKSIRFHRSSVLPWVLRQGAGEKSIASHTRAVILDPPREGLGSEFGAIATALEAMQVSQVIAIGCDPDSWAKDVSKWIKRGWKLKRMMAIDLFPQTHHIEAGGVLVK